MLACVWATLYPHVKDFWSTPISARPVALMRLVFGAVVLAGVLMNIAPSLLFFWGSDGMVPTETASRYAEYNDRISVFSLADSDAATVCWLVLYCITLVMVTIGCFTRVACAAAWLFAMSFSMRGWWVTNGGDDVTVIMLFYLMLTPCGATWSVDSLRRRLKDYKDPASGFDSPGSSIYVSERSGIVNVLDNQIAPWSVRLMQIQLCLIYFYNGLNKINVGDLSSWQAFIDANDYLSGKAVYYALNDNMLNRVPYDAMPIPFWICCLLSWATIVFEVGFPLLIMFRRVRPWMIVAGIGFHIGILITMEIGWFSQTMIAVYPVLLSGVGATAVVAFLARCGARRKYRLFYDTFCPICRRSKMVLDLMDIGGRLEFRDIHDREAMEREAPGVSYSRALKEMIVVRPSGKIDGGYYAFRTIAKGLPSLWPVMVLMYVPGVSWVGSRLYKMFARNRYRFKACDGDVCNLHLRALSQEHIEESEIMAIISRAREAAKVAVE